MKQKLYFVHIFTCEDTKLWVKEDDAKRQLEAYIRQIYGRLPEYHDGMGVMSREYDTEKLCYMGSAPFGCAGDYYMA